MNKLAEMLSGDSIKKLQKVKSALTPRRIIHSSKQRVIHPGDVFKIKANEENGITPKNGEKYRWKHFVVIGKLSDGTLYCCAAFDSNMNRDYIEPRFREFFLPIKAGTYPFIDHDSYIDCLTLKEATPNKLIRGRYEGRLSSEDLSKIIEHVKLNTKHNLAYLRLWGIT